MKVFISWSGDQSKTLAEIFRKWLPGVLQAVRPYFSPDDISKGARWEAEISKELSSSGIGLLFLTPDNTDAPWLLFEAGALAKNLEKSKVCPLLFGIEPTDIKGPLVQFQAARFEIEEIKRVVKMINAELEEHSLAPDVLDQVFEMWWPKLESQVSEVLKAQPEKRRSKESGRTERDLIEEVLSLTRTLSRSSPAADRNDINPAAVDDIARTVKELALLASEGGYPEVTHMVRRLNGPLMYIADHIDGAQRSRGTIAEAMELLDRPDLETARARAMRRQREMRRRDLEIEERKIESS